MVGYMFKNVELTAKGRSDVLFLFTAFALSKVIIIISFGIAYLLYPSLIEEGVNQFFCHWDCRWYVNVAEEGYDSIAHHWETGAGANWAFFPLLPIIIRLCHLIIGGDYRLSAIVFSQLVFFFSLWLFHTYAKGLSLPWLSNFPRRATILLAIWPYSAYFQVPMSESLFLPLSVTTFLCARDQRWLTAGIFGALLSATRIVGLAAVPLIGLFALQRRSIKSFARLDEGTEHVLLGAGIAGAGAGLFALYLHYRTGDALAFLHIQTAWNRSLKWPWMLFFDELNPDFAVSSPYLLHIYYTLIVILAFYLLFVLLRNRMWPELLFSSIAVSMVLTGGDLTSAPRVLGGVFPFVIAASVTTNTVPRRLILFGVALIIDISVWVALFLEGKIGTWAEFAM
jgi:Gpi18-like mannosyltransferase